MPRRKGGFRRVVAALLALALLALPGAPAWHAAAAAPPQQHAAHHCVTHDHMAHEGALSSHHRHDGQPDEHPGGMPGLGCCVSAQCPATVAVPLVPPGQPLRPSNLRLVGIATPVVPDGIAVAPPLHPPRSLA